MRSIALVCLAMASVSGAACAGESLAMDLFLPSADAGWRFAVVNDDVMGGVSTSRVAVEGQALVFSGTLSLERGGGFASMRAPTGSLDLGAYDGVELEVRGDRRRYQLTLRDADRSDAVLYRAPFETRVGPVQIVRLRFSEFEARFRGRAVPDAPPLDRRRIRQLGVLIADRKAGDFRLELRAVRAFR